MRRNSYYPLRQGDQVTWLTNFKGKIGELGAGLGLTAAQIAALQADCAWLIYVTGTWLPATRPWSLSCTDAFVEAQTGAGAVPQVLPVFNPPALPDGVVAVNPGALTRIFAAIQLIKDSGDRPDSVADQLGILGSEDTGPDVLTLQPEIKAVVKNGQVFVDWGWGGHGKWLDACEIMVDRGDGKGFVLLTIDTTPGYTDTQPFPAALVKWIYKAVYRHGDGQVGNWSDPVSVAVGG